MVRIKGHPAISRTFDTKGEAKTWVAEVEKEMRMGRYQDVRKAERITLVEAIDRYLERVSTNKCPNSEARDRISAKAILNYFGQEVTWADVDSKQVALYRDTQLEKKPDLT